MSAIAEIAREVERRSTEIIDLSRRIHADPETAFAEHRTSSLLRSVLEREGFAVSAAVPSLPTSFRAVFPGPDGRRRVTFTAEMDALPGLGHACGHNIIAAAGVFAAVVLKSVLGREASGTIEVLGTPAEESGSGKVRMIEDGAFRGSDVVLQVHPHSLDTVIDQALARRSLTVEFFGRSAHAAAAPGQGANALDALVLFYHGLALPRTKLPRGCLVHGVIEEGGRAPNVIPDYAKGRFSLRADRMSKLEGLVHRAVEEAAAAAQATGCRHRIIEPGPGVTTFKRNRVLEDLCAELMEIRGRSDPKRLRESFGSTDLANVSRVVPTIEVLLKASEAAIHTEEFRQDAIGPGGVRALLDGTFVMAAAGYRLLTEDDLLRRVKEDFTTQADPDLDPAPDGLA